MIDFLIVGAGLYGATCARILTDRGFNCLIIDKRNHIAGNIYTRKEIIDKISIDVHVYGPHVFHTSNTQVWNFVNRYTTMVPFQLNTIANYNDKLYHLPFNLTTMYELFGTYDVNEIRNIIEVEKDKFNKLNPDIKQSLETTAINMVGTTIYNTLIKEYTEKQWNKNCSKLSEDIIKRLPIRYTFNNNYFNDTYQGLPDKGYTDMIEKIIGNIPVLLNQDYLVNIEYWNTQAKRVIYCGAVDELMNYQLGELEWTSLEFEEKIVDTPNYQGIPIMNFTSSNVPYTRIIEHKWFTPHKFNNIINGSQITGSSIITYEYPTKWNNSKERYYPINNEKTNILYNNYCELMKMTYPNIILGGRLGLYKYLDMDDTIEQAMLFSYSTYIHN